MVLKSGGRNDTKQRKTINKHLKIAIVDLITFEMTFGYSVSRKAESQKAQETAVALINSW